MELKILRNFTTNENKKIEQLITELSNTKGAKTLAKDIKKWFDRGEIYPKEEERFIHWCNDSREARKKSRAITKQISEIIFGHI
jgi:hypothetical protein